MKSSYLTVKKLWYNLLVLNFFWRDKAQRTLSEVLSKGAGSNDDILDQIDEYYEDNGDDMDQCEEDFYSLSADELIEMIEIEVRDEDEDDEDDEDKPRLTDEEDDLYHHGFHD